MTKDIDNFNVVGLASSPDNDTIVITSAELEQQKWELAANHALSVFDPENKQYSAYLTESTSSETLTIERITELARGLQSNLANILTVNAIIKTYINKDDLIGITYDCIEANVNTEFKCTYKKFPEQRNKAKTVEDVRALIDDFNDQVNVRKILRTAIPIAFAEGTYIMYLRDKDDNYIVDYYPLGIAEISDYTSNGRPIVLINMQKLKSALNKTMLKDRKRRPLFFKDQEEEIKENYPPEVYQAYKDNETYAKLDVERTGVVRVGNLNRKYGVSPFFRALIPALMLETFDGTDRTNAKAKAKKIIHQKLRKELMGPNSDRNGYAQMALAHDNLMKAWKQSTVLVTTPPFVESIEYVEPESDMTNIDTVNQYRTREMAALGISFMNTDGTQTVSTANISLNQLMKNISKICQQLEDVFRDWYMFLLKKNGKDLTYCPHISIYASEMMGVEMKKMLAQFLFTTLNCSYETAYNILGYSVEDEKQKREKENENDFEDIFSSRATAYTTSGNSGGSGDDGDGESKPGRPAGEETDKQLYDKARNEAMK